MKCRKKLIKRDLGGGLGTGSGAVNVTTPGTTPMPSPLQGLGAQAGSLAAPAMDLAAGWVDKKWTPNQFGYSKAAPASAALRGAGKGAALGANPALVAATGGLSIAAGAVVGGAIGYLGGKKQNKIALENEAKYKEELADAEDEQQAQRSQAFYYNNPEYMYGNDRGNIMPFKRGGLLKKYNVGGMLQEGEYQGPTHADGGIPVNQEGQPDNNAPIAEVEGGETLLNNYIFSDRLGFDGKTNKGKDSFASIHKKLMKVSDRIDQNTDRYSQGVKDLLETIKTDMVFSQELQNTKQPTKGNEMKRGGLLKKYQYGGPTDPPAGKPKQFETLPYSGDAAKYPGGNLQYNPAKPEGEKILLPYNPAEPDQEPPMPTGLGNPQLTGVTNQLYNLGEQAGDIAPMLKLPKRSYTKPTGNPPLGSTRPDAEIDNTEPGINSTLTTPSNGSGVGVPKDNALEALKIPQFETNTSGEDSPAKTLEPSIESKQPQSQPQQRSGLGIGIDPVTGLRPATPEEMAAKNKYYNRRMAVEQGLNAVGTSLSHMDNLANYLSTLKKEKVQPPRERSTSYLKYENQYNREARRNNNTMLSRQLSNIRGNSSNSAVARNNQLAALSMYQDNLSGISQQEINTNLQGRQQVQNQNVGIEQYNNRLEQDYKEAITAKNIQRIDDQNANMVNLARDYEEGYTKGLRTREDLNYLRGQDKYYNDMQAQQQRNEAMQVENNLADTITEISSYEPQQQMAVINSLLGNPYLDPRYKNALEQQKKQLTKVGK